MPAKFIEQLELHAAEDSFVFHTLVINDVGAAVMLGRYRHLLKYLVRYSKRFAAASDEELIELMKRRLAPVSLAR